MEQLILHLIGDYILQSDWMAENKTKRWWPALVHASIYSAPFLLLVFFAGASYKAIALILVTHFCIDRYRLARYVVWAKNFIAPFTRTHTFEQVLAKRGLTGQVLSAGTAVEVLAEQRKPIRVNPPFSLCSATGYGPEKPIWLAVWLLIIADNTLHLAINYAALRWL